MVDTTHDQQTKTDHVHRALLAAYGEPTWRPHLDPVSELVSTILSQNTNEVNRDVAYDRLPTWELVRDADVDADVDAIRPAGLANQKGPRIQEALRTITRERGELDLDFLADWPMPREPIGVRWKGEPPPSRVASAWREGMLANNQPARFDETQQDRLCGCNAPRYALKPTEIVPFRANALHLRNQTRWPTGSKRRP